MNIRRRLLKRCIKKGWYDSNRLYNLIIEKEFCFKYRLLLRLMGV